MKELVEETEKDKILLERLKVKNEIIKTHNSVKKQLSLAKKESFNNTTFGKVLKGLKAEINKRSEKNKKKSSSKKEDDEWVPGILKD